VNFSVQAFIMAYDGQSVPWMFGRLFVVFAPGIQIGRPQGLRMFLNLRVQAGFVDYITCIAQCRDAGNTKDNECWEVLRRKLEKGEEEGQGERKGGGEVR